MKYKNLHQLVPLPPAPGVLDASRANQNIVEPHRNDVLCGRGGLSNNHVGNVAWRQMVADNQEEYLSLSKKDKSYLSRRIVDTIRDQDPPGRFLKKNNKTGLWCDIGDKDAQRKTSQALREGAPERRKKEETPDDSMKMKCSDEADAVVSRKDGSKIYVAKMKNKGATVEEDKEADQSSEQSPVLSTRLDKESEEKKEEKESSQDSKQSKQQQRRIIVQQPQQTQPGDLDQPQQRRQQLNVRDEFARQQSWGSVMFSSSWASVESGIQDHAMVTESSNRSISNLSTQDMKLEEISVGMGSMSITRHSAAEMSLCREFSMKSMSSRSVYSKATTFKSISSRSLVSRDLSMSCGSLGQSEHEMMNNNTASNAKNNRRCSAEMPPLVSCIADDHDSENSKVSPDNNDDYDSNSLGISFDDDDNSVTSLQTNNSNMSTFGQPNEQSFNRMLIVDRCPVPRFN